MRCTLSCCESASDSTSSSLRVQVTHTEAIMLHTGRKLIDPVIIFPYRLLASVTCRGLKNKGHPSPSKTGSFSSNALGATAPSILSVT
eukprot:scaffold619_cov403-Prasinococcus_capsulatus_cf.AAC.3